MAKLILHRDMGVGMRTGVQEWGGEDGQAHGVGGEIKDGA